MERVYEQDNMTYYSFDNEFEWNNKLRKLWNNKKIKSWKYKNIEGKDIYFISISK